MKTYSVIDSDQLAERIKYLKKENEMGDFSEDVQMLNRHEIEILEKILEKSKLLKPMLDRVFREGTVATKAYSHFGFERYSDDATVKFNDTDIEQHKESYIQHLLEK